MYFSYIFEKFSAHQKSIINIKFSQNLKYAFVAYFWVSWKGKLRFNLKITRKFKNP